MPRRIQPPSGTTDEKGHWKPDRPAEYPPLFIKPRNFRAGFAWIFGWGGYLWPRHLSYGILALVSWFFLQANLAATTQLSAGWILLMLGRNALLMLIVFGFYHLSLYVWKWQGNAGKYHPQGMGRQAKKYKFKDQVKDNMFYSLVSGVPIWTAWEVIYFWAAGNGLTPLIQWGSNPVWFGILFLLIPLWRDTHFYFVHRFLHWKPMLRHIHSVHHRNPNPGPWTGMSMHPVEHLLYFSVVVIHFIVPSHPVHLLYNSQLTALTPAQGHTGFEGPLFGFWPVGDYFHYLHHKHVNCNFGVAQIPWDKWLGRYYNGEGPFKIKH